jgi:hypothetical protein
MDISTEKYKELLAGYKRKKHIVNKNKEKLIIKALEFHISNESDSLTMTVDFINKKYPSYGSIDINDLKEILFLYDPQKFRKFHDDLHYSH